MTENSGKKCFQLLSEMIQDTLRSTATHHERAMVMLLRALFVRLSLHSVVHTYHLFYVIICTTFRNLVVTCFLYRVVFYCLWRCKHTNHDVWINVEHASLWMSLKPLPSFERFPRLLVVGVFMKSVTACWWRVEFGQSSDIMMQIFLPMQFWPESKLGNVCVLLNKILDTLQGAHRPQNTHARTQRSRKTCIWIGLLFNVLTWTYTCCLELKCDDTSRNDAFAWFKWCTPSLFPKDLPYYFQGLFFTLWGRMRTFLVDLPFISSFWESNSLDFWGEYV